MLQLLGFLTWMIFDPTPQQRAVAAVDKAITAGTYVLTLRDGTRVLSSYYYRENVVALV